MKYAAFGFVPLVYVFGLTSTAQITPHAKMPPDISVLHEAAGGEITSDSRCEVLEWILDPTHGWPTDVGGPVDMAKQHVNACRIAHEDITPEVAARRLGQEAFQFDVEGDVMTVVARSGGDEVGLCCAPNGSLSRLDETAYWVARYRMAHLDRAMITIVPDGAFASPDAWKYYRGKLAPPAPNETPIGQWKGQMLEREIPSEALGETRRLMIYLPPGYSKARVWPALFMADAGAVEFAGLVEAMIAAREIEPIVIISADSGERGVVGQAPTQFGDLRAAEYLPETPQGAARFAPHLKFFSEELVTYAVDTFHVSSDRKDRAVAGKSNGGVFALWAGIQRSDVFASSVGMSPGWKPAERDKLKRVPDTRFFLSAGLYEAPFIMSAQNWEGALKLAGYDVRGRYYAAGHMHDQWAIALREALVELFPVR
jgi:enterochelin esterase-like enzyme